MKVDKIKRCF